MKFSVRLQTLLLRAAALLLAPIDHRGLGRVAVALGRVFPSDNSVVRTLPDGRLRVHLDDGYWARLLVPGWHYEPEVEMALRVAEPRTTSSS